MKIVAALAWYLEPPEFLDRLVRSLGGVVDELVALDGRWDLFNDQAGKSFLSPSDETRAIADAGAAVGVRVNFGHVQGVWESQVAKRNALMRKACAIGATHVMVVDGDEWVSRCDGPGLRQALASSSAHVWRLAFMTEAGAMQGYPDQPIRRIYLASPSLRVELAHNGYRDDTGWLHGDSAFVDLLPAEDLSVHLAMRHELMSRGDERNAMRLEYRAGRRRDRLEWSQ